MQLMARYDVFAWRLCWEIEMERLIGISLALIATVSVALLLKSSVIALSLWFMTTWPEKCGQVYTTYRERPWRCGLIGLVNTVVFVFIGLALTSREPFALLGLLILLTVCVLHVAGRTAVHRRMAVKLDLDGADVCAPRAIVLGGAIAELTFLVPIIGQILYLGTTMRAMGAVVVALLSRGEGALPPE